MFKTQFWLALAKLGRIDYICHSKK